MCFITSWICQSQDLTITGITREQNQTTLSWFGGTPPFQLQQSVDLSEWNDVADPVDSHEISLGSDEVLRFFRIRSLPSTPNLEGYVGQLRVAEGEFGEPLARHRLKSIWDVYYPEGDSANLTALEFFNRVIVKLEILEGRGHTIMTAPLNGFPQATVTNSEKSIRSEWSTGLGDDKRDYTLEMTFRFDVNERRPSIHLSDPFYKLTWRYAQPQFLIDRSGDLGETREDEVELVEIADNSNAPAWWQRHLEVSKGDVTVDSRYEIGVPNLGGGPAFIFKTPLLTQWDGCETGFFVLGS
jgi:hypothetical protein